MKRMLKVLIVAAGFGLLPAAASADTFMLIPGVTGDVTDPARKGWIRVLSCEWGVQNVTVIGTATGGAGAGKPTARGFKVKIPTGPWSREMLSNLVRGAHYPQIVIDHVNPDGRPAYRVTIQLLFLTDYRNAPGSKAPAEDEIEGVYGGFRAEYFTVGPDGRVSSSAVGWNFVSNTEVK